MNRTQQFFFALPFFMHAVFPAQTSFNDNFSLFRSVDADAVLSLPVTDLFDLGIPETDIISDPDQSSKRQCTLRSKDCDVLEQQLLSGVELFSFALDSVPITEFDERNRQDSPSVVLAHCTYASCSKNFEKPSLLVMHLLREHLADLVGKDDSFTCPDRSCSKALVSKVSLIKHIENKHLEFCDTVCATCCKGFLTTDRLEKHTDYTCSVAGCTYVTRRIGDHKIHESRHREGFKRKKKRSKPSSSPSRSYTCLDIFYQCKLCAERFKQADLSAKHLFEKHVATKKDMDKIVAFFCPAPNCKESYTRKHALVEHVGGKHLELCALVCNVCPKGFLTQKRFEKHVHHRCSVEDCTYFTDRKGDWNLHQKRHIERIERIEQRYLQ